MSHSAAPELSARCKLPVRSRNMRIPIRLLARMHLSFAVFAALLLLPARRAAAQNTNSDDQDKNLDIQLHVGKDADAQKVGLPLYPGARLKHDEENQKRANFALLTGAFGMKLVVANYDSGDTPGNVVELKAGTEDNQHVVSVEPSETGKGSTFALVYLFTRGKQGDI